MDIGIMDIEAFVLKALYTYIFATCTFISTSGTTMTTVYKILDFMFSMLPHLKKC